MKTKFKFVVPSYNNEEWVEYNIASILNQTYENYEVLYIDDASKDNTYNKVLEIVSNDSRFKVIRREENKGAAYNYFFELEDYLNNDEDIIIHLDGDDWLYDENVLKNLLDYYEKHGVWMTYGKFLCYSGGDSVIEANPQNTPHSNYVKHNKLYRKDIWRASHLRTYKTFLFKSINKDDLYSKIDGKLFWHALDLAFQYPYMEMCPKEKIGVVDFPTCIYNQAPKNTERTREREHSDNSKYEDEIRNKKVYKTGLSGETLPQINVYGDYLERQFHASKFTYCYNRGIYGDYDAVFFQDGTILNYLLGEYKIKDGVKKIAKVSENRKFFNQEYIAQKVKANYDKFDLILTWDPELLKLPNAKFCPITDISQFNILPHTQFILNKQFSKDMFNKTKMVSAVSSNKIMLNGHSKRLKFVTAVKDKVDLYGRGINEISSKLFALVDYRFSIAIENDISENYFTEKITDCFLTGTIPIYHGATNIEDFFDINGIIRFDTLEELHNILDNLTPELYNSKLKSIENNFYKCFDYPTDCDSMYDLYYKNLLK